MKKALSVATLAVLLAFCPGCGLLFVPHVQEFPADSTRRIVVRDAATDQPLNDAKVVLHLYEWSNWYLPRPCPPVKDRDLDTAVRASYERTLERQTANFVGRGVFVLEPHKKCGWAQIFFPIPSPLGWTLYRTYDAAICVSAPEHVGVWIGHALTPADLQYWREHAEARGPRTDAIDLVTFESGTLVVKLPPLHRSP